MKDIREQQPNLRGPLMKTVRDCFFSYDTRNYNLEKFDECMTKKRHTFDAEKKALVDDCYREDLQFATWEMCDGINRHSTDIPAGPMPGGFDYTNVGSTPELDAQLEDLRSQISTKA